MHNAQRRLLLLHNNELETVALVNDANLLHRVYNEVRPTVLDLLPLVARAHSNHNRARGNASPDPGRRVLEHDTTLRVVPEFLRREQERVGSGLAGLQPLVVGRDGDFGGRDADAGHAAIR